MSGFAWALLLVAIFIIGQVSMLRPSLRDKRLMELRREARVQGLHPRLLPPPSWYRRERPAGGLLPCYSLMSTDDSKGFAPFLAERLSDDEWVVRTGPRHALQGIVMPPLALQAFALEAQSNAISLWWTEEGSVEDLSVLKNWLEAVKTRLQASTSSSN